LGAGGGGGAGGGAASDANDEASHTTAKQKEFRYWISVPTGREGGGDVLVAAQQRSRHAEHRSSVCLFVGHTDQRFVPIGNGTHDFLHRIAVVNPRQHNTWPYRSESAGVGLVFFNFF
jgi:hypothetical protein